MVRRHDPEAGPQYLESGSEGGDPKSGAKGKGKAMLGDKTMNKGKKRVNVERSNVGCDDCKLTFPPGCRTKG